MGVAEFIKWCYVFGVLPGGGGGGGGDVVGPGSSTENGIAVFADATGKLLRSTGITIDNSDNIIFPANVTAKKIILTGDDDFIGLAWVGADMQNYEQVQNAQLQAMAVIDVAGNQYYHINSQTNRPKFSFDIETQINTSFINTGVQASGQIYNPSGTLSASCSGFVVTGTGTTFPTNCVNGVIYWPSTRQYARITQRTSATALNVDTTITQASAPFVIYYGGITYNPQSNVVGLNAATVFSGDFQTTSGIQWNVNSITNLTVSQTGNQITFSTNPSSVAAGGYVVPASGSPVRLLGYAGTATFPCDLSQTIAPGTACTLYFFDNTTTQGQILQQQPVTQTLFPGSQRISIGSSGGAFLSVWNHAGSQAFGNGVAVGSGSTAMSGTGIASQSGTTVTASTSVFTAAHVGRLIRFGQGYTAFIRGYTSGTVVTVDVSQTVPLQSFFIVGTSTNEAVSAGANGDLGCARFYNRTQAQFFGAQYGAPRIISATPATVSATDYMLSVNVASAVTLNIPAATGSGRVLIIKDKSGAAATNNITITPASGNIENASTYLLNTNGGSVSLFDDVSANWSAI